MRSSGVPQIRHEHGVKVVHAFNAPIYRFVASTCSHVIGPSDAVNRALGSAGIHAPVLRTSTTASTLAGSPAPTGACRQPARRSAPVPTPAGRALRQAVAAQGPSLLIDAAPAIVQACPAARFVIVGALENPAYEAELRAEIAGRGLTDRVVFTGWRRDVQDVMSAMDVVVVPTLTPEPAALSLMEAMALSRPLVASNTGGTPELVVDESTGLLFPTGHADALAAQVIRAVTDDTLAERLGGPAAPAWKRGSPKRGTRRRCQPLRRRNRGPRPGNGLTHGQVVGLAQLGGARLDLPLMASSRRASNPAGCSGPPAPGP